MVRARGSPALHAVQARPSYVGERHTEGPSPRRPTWSCGRGTSEDLRSNVHDRLELEARDAVGEVGVDSAMPPIFWAGWAASARCLQAKLSTSAPSPRIGATRLFLSGEPAAGSDAGRLSLLGKCMKAGIGQALFICLLVCSSRYGYCTCYDMAVGTKHLKKWASGRNGLLLAYCLAPCGRAWTTSEHEGQVAGGPQTARAAAAKPLC